MKSPRQSPGSSARAPWRERLYGTIFEHEPGPGRTFDVVLLIAILVSVLIVSLETVDSYRTRYGTLMTVLEWTFTVLFTGEYVARLLSHPRPSRYARSFFGVVDLVSILPTWLSLIIPGTQALAVLRGLRILRVFRILKLAQFVSEAEALRRALAQSLPKISVFVVFVLCSVTICGALMHLIEGPDSAFSSIPQGVWWAIVTLSTVGYGDIVPTTLLGKMLASLIMIAGYGVIAVPTGIVTAELARGPRSFLARTCASCGLTGHDADANHCKGCGARL